MGDETLPLRVALDHREQVAHLDWHPCDSIYHLDGVEHAGDAHYRVEVLHRCRPGQAQIANRCKRSIDVAMRRDMVCAQCRRVVPKGQQYRIIRVLRA